MTKNLTALGIDTTDKLFWSLTVEKKGLKRARIRSGYNAVLSLFTSTKIGKFIPEADRWRYLTGFWR